MSKQIGTLRRPRQRQSINLKMRKLENLILACLKTMPFRTLTSDNRMVRLSIG